MSRTFSVALVSLPFSINVFLGGIEIPGFF